jgi:hypothetical protein
VASPVAELAMINLYSPQNEVDLALLKSLFASEGINYCVKNDYFGSLKVGPRIALYNMKIIEVQDDQYEIAKTFLDDYLDKATMDEAETRYAFFDKLRMAIEVFMLGWIVSGSRHTKDHR